MESVEEICEERMNHHLLSIHPETASIGTEKERVLEAEVDLTSEPMSENPYMDFQKKFFSQKDGPVITEKKKERFLKRFQRCL